MQNNNKLDNKPLNKYEYVTIDFETANGNLTSACSVGIVCAKNGKIVNEKYYLINPMEEFYSGNILIHGITKDMVKDAKVFSDLWDEIYEIINNEIVFAHAASFDISVLRALINKYNLKIPNIKIGCTLKSSRIVFKDVLQSFKLSALSHHLEVDHNHHNAISDAEICYHILERSKRMYQVYDVYDLFESIGLCFGHLNHESYRGCYSRIDKKKVKKISNELEGLVIAFTGKPNFMTKTEFKKKILELGGLYSKEVSKVINTFIVFSNPTKAHLNALERVREYKKVTIYTEEEIKKLINGK